MAVETTIYFNLATILFAIDGFRALVVVIPPRFHTAVWVRVVLKRIADIPDARRNGEGRSAHQAQ